MDEPLEQFIPIPLAEVIAAREQRHQDQLCGIDLEEPKIISQSEEYWIKNKIKTK